jgi:O-antigen/teichoic acid export membrane protein
VAKSLGPGEYGNLTFLLGSFAAFATLTDMGSSFAFFTFISRNRRGRRFLVYYGGWVLIQLGLLVLMVLFLPASLKGKIWLGHSMELILLALFASFTTNQLWQYLAQIGESIRDTVGVQIRNFLLVVSYFFCIILLAKFNLINIKVIFIVNIILSIIFTAFYGRQLSKKAVFFDETPETISNMLKEFKSYCLPLIVYNWVGFFYTFADYWLLQKFGGSVQQGYYAIGARFAALSLIATTSVLQVMWKEISEANALGNVERVRLLYDKITRSLFFLGALMSCLFIPFSREILAWLLGPAFQDAWVPLVIMFFYPIYQSLGQISGMMLYALGQTRAKTLIGIGFMAFSIPATFLFLASPSSIIPGLHLGAKGLALKMVICQLIEVNVMAFIVGRYIQHKFNYGHQFAVIFTLLPIAFFSKYFTQGFFSLLSLNDSSLLIMSISGVIYLSLIIPLIWYIPSLAGITTQQMRHSIFWLRERFT